ncbi:MAG: GIY-YIG nuclease family protein [Melioribacteraceae bacterium]
MFYYVYILKSLVNLEKYYTGYTEDLKKRIIKHNEGGVPYTSNYKPWEIKNYFAFREKVKALKFEKYLKSHSGRAFSKKHF